MIKAISNSEGKVWKSLLADFNSVDFYHTHTYNQLDKTGQPLLLLFEKDSFKILMSIVMRQIPGSEHNDVTSVYGYAGPVSNIINLPVAILRDFQLSLDSFFIQNKVIAAFSRLHPLIDYQENIFSGYGDIVALNKTVSIDLTQDKEIQRQQFDKSLKNRLNKLRKSGVKVKYVTTIDELREFVSIYIETMERLEASKMYFFDLEYFQNLLNAKDFKSFILIAIYENEILAGSFFTVYGDIMQYHLSGTKTKFLKMAPMKLLLDEARLIANEMELKHFHLGGGVGGINDSLFEFKAAFSKTYHQFKIWKKIINPEVYNELVKNRFGNSIPTSDYFPLYRY